MVATNTFVSELQKRENNVAKVLTDTRIIAKYTVGQMGVRNNIFILYNEFQHKR